MIESIGVLVTNKDGLLSVLPSDANISVISNTLDVVINSKHLIPTHIQVFFYQESRFLAPKILPTYVTRLATLKSATIIIPTKDGLEFLKRCVDSILMITDYDSIDYEIIVVDNQTTEPGALDYLRSIDMNDNVRVVSYRDKFNYSSINNYAAGLASGDLLVFLNNDTIVLRPDWLKILTKWAEDSSIGAIGAKLLYPDYTVQHGGVVVGIQGVAAHAHISLPSNARGFQNWNQITREALAVTGACLAVRKSIFEEVGGFDSDFAVAFNDIALCISIARRGYRNLWVSEPLFYHLESKTRGYDSTTEKRIKMFEEALLFNKLYWPPGAEDPSYNLNLSLENVYQLAEPVRFTRRWRFASKLKYRKRILILSSTFLQGHGVAVVIAIQAKRLIELGYDVWFGGPLSDKEIVVAGIQRINISNARLAARFAVRFNMDLAISHTPPFYSVARFLGVYPAFIAYDYGEPPASLFPDFEARIAVNREKAFCFAKSRFRAAISNSVAHENGESNLKVLPLANSHLSTWTDSSNEQRERLRDSYQWSDAFVILSVCRFHLAERFYKGVTDYVELTSRVKMMNPGRKVIVVLCGKGSPEDILEMESKGVNVFANVSDEEVRDLYLAADIFISLSRWEGYNLGIGQALALGLPVLASKIPAHDAFKVDTFDQQSRLLDRLNEFVRSDLPVRKARVLDWDEHLSILCEYIDDCIAVSRKEATEHSLGSFSVSPFSSRETDCG